MDFPDHIQDLDYDVLAGDYSPVSIVDPSPAYNLSHKKRRRADQNEREHIMSKIRVTLSRIPACKQSAPECKNILDLPTEMLHLILLRVCEHSFRDICCAGATCTAFRDVSIDDLFYREVDLFAVSFPDVYQYGVATFMNSCEKHGNLSALFVRGTFEYFREWNLVEGLAMIREAAYKGYDMAKYAYANIKRIMFPRDCLDDDSINLDRDFVCRMRHRVDSVDIAAYYYVLPPIFELGIREVPSADLFACGCSPHNILIGPSNEALESPQMCESCFWIIQMMFFTESFTVRVIEWPRKLN